MRKHIKLAFYLFVLFGFSWSHAGSYEEFFRAIKHDDAQAVRGLLRRGFDPNTVNPKGEPALIQAFKEGSLKVIDVLVDAPQTQIEVRTLQDESPLMLAALKGYVDICEKLIDRDADVNKPGWAPLHYAATGGHDAVVLLLLENAAYIDAASPNGSTPLMMAAHYGTASAVRVLLDAGADVSVKNDLGLTALDFAMRGQRPESAAIIAEFQRAQQPKGW
jgi:uncharacterized protein